MPDLIRCKVGIEEGVLVNAASHTSPKYGERYYQSRGSKREVDLQPYRRFFAALVLQQVCTGGRSHSLEPQFFYNTFQSMQTGGWAA